MIIQKLFILLFLLLIVDSCSKNKTGSDKNKTGKTQNLTFPVKPLSVDNGEEDGWGAEIRLIITNIDTINNTVIYKAQSTYKKKTVGLDFEFLLSNQDKITLKSSLSISDNLLITLSQLYKQKTRTTRQFVKSSSVSCIDLQSFAKENLGATNTV